MCCDLAVGARGLFAQTDRYANETNGCTELLSLPPRLALAEKSVNPFLEIEARIGLHDVLRAAGWGPMPHDQVQLLLGGANRDRGMLSHGAGHLIGSRVEPVLGGDLIEQPGGAHLLRIHQAREQDDVLGARDADERRETRVVSRGQGVAQRARDGEPELRARSADAEVAGSGDAGAATGARTLDR